MEAETEGVGSYGRVNGIVDTENLRDEQKHGNGVDARVCVHGNEDNDLDGGDREEDEDHDVDDDDSISSSSMSSIISSLLSSSDEEDDEDAHSSSLTLMERQARNMERNARFLGNLHEKYKAKLPPSNRQDFTSNESKVDTMEEEDDDDLEEEEEEELGKRYSSGILMKGTCRLFQSLPKQTSQQQPSLIRQIQQIRQRYPHRDSQIQQLMAILSGTLSISSTIRNSVTNNHNNSNNVHNPVHVPAPIFCVGPPGTGKTSVVCDIVEVLQNTYPAELPAVARKPPTLLQQSTPLKAAYVDCSILEPSSIERLVYHAYQQLRPVVALRNGKKRKLNQRKRRNQQKRRRLHLPNGHELRQFLNVHKVITNDTAMSPWTQKENNNLSNTNGILKGTTEHDPQQQQQTQRQQPNPAAEAVEASQRRILPGRSAKKGVSHDSESSAAVRINRSELSNEGTVTSNRDGSKSSGRRHKNRDYVKEAKVETSNSAVISLGRSLQPYYGMTTTLSGLHTGFLILDRADELLSLSSSAKKSKRRIRQKNGSASSYCAASSTQNPTTNFLAELLMLPKIMKLNLTVIVITNYATLDKTRKFQVPYLFSVAAAGDFLLRFIFC